MRSDLIKIRRAQTKDTEDLQLIHEASWRNSYEGILPYRDLQRILNGRTKQYWVRAINRDGNLFVLDFDDRPVGYLTIGLSSRRAVSKLARRGRFGEILELYLHPVFQGVGFGTKMWECARDSFQARGYEGFVVRALAENMGARRFYERLGGKLLFTDGEVYSGRSVPIVTYYWLLPR